MDNHVFSRELSALPFFHLRIFERVVAIQQHWTGYLNVPVAFQVSGVLKWTLTSLCTQKLARWFVFPNGAKGLKNGAREAGEKKIPKFTESAWKLTYYLATEVFVVLITYNEPWFGNTSAFWHGWPYQTLKYVPFHLSASISWARCAYSFPGACWVFRAFDQKKLFCHAWFICRQVQLLIVDSGQHFPQLSWIDCQEHASQTLLHIYIYI
jgi:hypothetical protein